MNALAAIHDHDAGSVGDGLLLFGASVSAMAVPYLPLIFQAMCAAAALYGAVITRERIVRDRRRWAEEDARRRDEARPAD